MRKAAHIIVNTLTNCKVRLHSDVYADVAESPSAFRYASSCNTVLQLYGNIMPGVEEAPTYAKHNIPQLAAVYK